MNIEIANRLVKLRKEKGFSQEELAEKLGLSRQAVSKWERAESSPDTDNLICLAKLYNISLDELLSTDDDIETIKDSVMDKKDNSKKKVKISPTGIYVKDEEDEVELSLSGIYINSSDGDQVVIGNKPYDQLNEKEKKIRRIKEKFDAVYSILVVATYIILGAIFDFWHPGWILFITIPLVSSIFEAIASKNWKAFSFPVLAVIVFFVLGFEFDLWHPGWVVFILIPVYYAIVPGKTIVKVNGEIELGDDNEEDN